MGFIGNPQWKFGHGKIIDQFFWDFQPRVITLDYRYIKWERITLVGATPLKSVIFQMGRKNQQYLGNFQSQYWDPLESNDSNRDRQTIVFLVREGGPLGGIFHLQTNHNKVTGCWCKPT